jgi:hypothetical protein
MYPAKLSVSSLLLHVPQLALLVSVDNRQLDISVQRIIRKSLDLIWVIIMPDEVTSKSAHGIVSKDPLLDLRKLATIEYLDAYQFRTTGIS